MALTMLSRAELAKRSKRIAIRPRIKTSHPESDTFEEFRIADGGFRLTRESGLPAMLEIEPAPPDGGFGAETDPANRFQLFARIEVWCEVFLAAGGSETERLFDGIVTEIERIDGRLKLVALDMLHVLSRTVTSVAFDASAVAIADGAPLASAPELGAFAYGLDVSETPDGFSAEGKRRSWKQSDVRVTNSSGAEIPPAAYAVYPDSGAVVFHSAPGGAIFVNGVRCYVEGTADVSAIIAAALAYPKPLGGPGISGGDLDFDNLGLDINRVRWDETDGSVFDFWRFLKRSLPGNVFLYYDSASGKYKLASAAQQETPQLALINPIRVESPFDGYGVQTRVVVKGDVPQPRPISETAIVTDLLNGDGDIFRWNGNAKIFGEGSLSLVKDGDGNTGFGRHNLSGEPYAWRDFARLDLGLGADGKPRRITRIDVVAANSHNPNSQGAASLKFLYGVEILGSADGESYERISRDAVMYLKPLEVRTIENPVFDGARFLKIRIKPAKDGLSNDGDPAAALNEIRVYGTQKFAAVAQAQAEDSEADFYYPALLEKTSLIGHLTFVEDASGLFDEFAARKRASDLLGEFVRAFQRAEYSSVFDPMLKPLITVEIADEMTGTEAGILVEKVVMDGRKTLAQGTNYLAEPLA